MKRSLSAILFCLMPALLLPHALYAQLAGFNLDTREYTLKTWDNTTGLPSNAVSSIAKDKTGYLWLATERGLVRFNGSNFYTFDTENTPGLETTLIYHVVKSPDGGIWASTAQQVLRVVNGSVSIYNLHEKDSRIIWITALEMVDSGNLWIGTNSGDLFTFSEGNLIEIESWRDVSSGSVQVIKKTEFGILAGTSEGLFFVDFENKVLELDDFSGLYIRSVLESSETGLWVGTLNNGLYNYSNGDIHHFGTEDGLADRFVNALAEDEDGRIWIGLGSAGIQLLINGEITPFQETSDEFDEVRYLYSTGKGSVWASTSQFGLVHIRKGLINNITAREGLSSNIILGVYQHENGDIWIGTAGAGVNRISGGTITTYTYEDGLGHDIVLGMNGNDEYVYLATGIGLSRFNISEGRIDRTFTEEDGMKSSTVFGVYRDSRDRMWVTGRNGAIYEIIDNETLVAADLPENLNYAEFTAVFEDSAENLWFGSVVGGIVVRSPDGTFRAYDPQNYYPVETVLDFYEDEEGEIWMSTEYGLLLFRDGSFTRFGTENGFYSNTMSRIIPYNDKLWIGSMEGIQKVYKQDLLKLKHGKTDRISVRLFDRSDGMMNHEVNGGFYPSGWTMQDNTIWFPTMHGVAILDPERTEEETATLSVLIESVSYGGMVFSDFDDLYIPAGVYNTEISFTSLEFSKPQTISYYFRLKGLSDEWQHAGSRHTAYFTSIPPGTYQFEVKAEQFGKMSETAVIDLRVGAFLYQTTWFRVLLLFVLFMAGYFIRVFYAKHKTQVLLKETVDEKTRELSDRNADLENVLRDLGRQNEVLKEVAWVQAHELRGPLSRLLGMIEVLENYDSYKTIKKSKEEIEREIAASARELDVIIRRLNRQIEDIDENQNTS